MNDLSLKGVARRYLNETGSISVKQDVMTGTGSLRARLEDLASTEVSFSMSECIYGWTAAFEQTWTHILVRIDLNPDTGVGLGNLPNTWATGIANTWNNQWRCARDGELPCRFSFEVAWVNTGEHFNVRVRSGPATSNQTTWDNQDTGAVASHEFGHMLGHPDEYASNTCPSRNPVNTGTVMDNNSANVPSRLMTAFANRLNSNVVG